MDAHSFVVGDEVEFHSSDHGGCWKHGVVVQYVGEFRYDMSNRPLRSSNLLRIRVSDTVYVVRSIKSCRRVSQ